MGDDAETAVLAGGRARIMQQLQRQSDGVISTRTGFMGGENDSPYSEAWFKTLKFAPVFPERFGSLADARTFMASFVYGYNHVHRHTGIGLNAAADVRYGLAAGKATQRSAVLATARTRNPERFSSTQDPKILTIPDAAWINQPTNRQTETEPTQAQQAA